MLFIVKRYELLCERALYKCNLLLLLTTADGCRCKETEFAAHWFQCTKLKCLSWVLGPQEQPRTHQTTEWRRRESLSQNEEVLVGQHMSAFCYRKTAGLIDFSCSLCNDFPGLLCTSSSHLGCCYFFLLLCKSMGAAGSRCTEPITWLLLSRWLLWDRGLITEAVPPFVLR